MTHCLHTWYLNPNSSSVSSMLPPRHSVTLNPSSLNSPVNSKLTPPSRELQSEWMRIQEVSSLIMVPKLRVLRPVLDVRVLRFEDEFNERLHGNRSRVLKERTFHAWDRRSRRQDAQTFGQKQYAQEGDHLSLGNFFHSFERQRSRVEHTFPAP